MGPYSFQSSNIPLLPLWLGIHCFTRRMNRKMERGTALKKVLERVINSYSEKFTATAKINFGCL